MLPSTGHLRVTVAPSQATVEYVRSNGGDSYTYTIAPNTPPVTHDLTLAVSPNGAGTTNPAVGLHSYTENAVVNITATPALGYTFSSWTGGVADPNAASTTVTMNADKTVTANFVAVSTYVLTTAVNPPGGGTINPAAGPHTYNQSTVVAVTATPSSGYAFSSWTGACSGSGACSVTMDAAKSVTANFTLLPTYVLTMATDGNGTTTPAMGAHLYPQGTVVPISTTPNSGYIFDSWTGDADCADGSVTMNAAKTCTANFVTAPPAVTLDGAVSSGTSAPTTSGVSFSHTTGTGADRLLLVGVSWNCGTTNRTISSITFTPNGGSALNLTEVKTQQYSFTSSGTQYRYTAIYSLLNPGSGVLGTVNITFSGAVSNGIISGAANFAGVDQTTPLGTPNGAVGTGTSSSGTPNPTVTLTGLTGSELVFDSVFMGASSTSHTMTADSGQSELWNILGYTASSSFNAAALPARSRLRGHLPP